MCGNFGLLAVIESADNDKLVAELLRNMAALTELRGALGGGLAVTSWSTGAVPTATSAKRVRIIQDKRKVLSDELLKRYIRITTSLKERLFPGLPFAPRLVGVVGHTRYPTSSRSVVAELHPHRWTPHHHSKEPTWFAPAHGGDDRAVFNGRDHGSGAASDDDPQAIPTLESSKALRGTYLCHNGDFDEYELFGQIVSYATLGRWLGRVLPGGPHEAVGDSPKVAGILELLKSKGCWDKSVRLAYQMCIAARVGDAAGGDHNLAEASPNTAPTSTWCDAMGLRFHVLWKQICAQSGAAPEAVESTGLSTTARASASERLVGHGGKGASTIDSAAVSMEEPGSQSSIEGTLGGSELIMALMVEKCKAASVTWAEVDPLVASWPLDKRALFVTATVDKFLRADLFSAMSEFMSKAHGSFGLQAICASEPHAAVIAAKGQAMRLAVAPSARLAMWGSEGSAIEVPIPGNSVRFVLRLDSLQGQVIEVKSHPPDAAAVELAGYASAAASGGPRAQGKFTVGWTQITLRSFNVAHQRMVSAEDLRRQFRIFSAPRLALPNDLAERSDQRVLMGGGTKHKDDVLRDIRSIPAVLDLIIGKWRDGAFDPRNSSRKSASAFVKAVAKAMSADAGSHPNVDKLHLLVAGIEVSLFVAEQFAVDMVEFVSGLNAKAVSSNQLVAGDKIYFAARDTKGSLDLDLLRRSNTVVLIVSQSGQTFPSLKATARLVEQLGSQVFVLVGGPEELAPFTEMGSIIMNYHREQLGRDGADHIFSNLSGPRPSEPSTVAVVATHQTLTELLVFTRLSIEQERVAVTASGDKIAEPLKKKGRERTRFKEAVIALTQPALQNIQNITGCDVHGVLTYSGRNVERLKRGRRSICASMCRCLGVVGRNVFDDEHSHDGRNAGKVHEELVAIGMRWGQHISEPWRVMFLAGCYIAVTVTFGCPLFKCILVVALNVAGLATTGSNTKDTIESSCWAGVSTYTFGGEGVGEDGKVPNCFTSDDYILAMAFVVGTAVSALDAWFYVMCPVFAGRFLRWKEGRPLYHRFGKRTLIVADVPWVSSCTEALVSKLYALAYGFCSLDVHSTDPVDDMIHKFGHRSVRGLLVAVGRPDGRLIAFTKTESAVLLSAKQISFVENLGENPEVVSIGSNPHFDPRNVFAHVALPSVGRPQFIDEFVHSHMYERQKRQQLEGAAGRTGRKDQTSWAFLQSVRRALHLNREQERLGLGISTRQFEHGVLGVEALIDISASSMDMSSSIYAGHHGGDRSSSASNEGSVERNSGTGSDDITQGITLSSRSSTARFAETSAFHANLDVKTHQFFLSEFTLSQRLLEARFNTLERFVSFCVLFHAAAEQTNAGLWGLPRWNMSRSQSHMRVNSTACPILAGSATASATGGGKGPEGGLPDEVVSPSAAAAAASSSSSSSSSSTRSFPGSIVNQPLESLLQGRLRLLRLVRHFQSTSDVDLERVATALREVEFRCGDWLVREGEVGDAMFIIESGEAVVTLRSSSTDIQKQRRQEQLQPFPGLPETTSAEDAGSPDDEDNFDIGREVERCGVGDHFGDASLLRTGFRHPASVVCVTPRMLCLVLTRDEYLRLASSQQSNSSAGPPASENESPPPRLVSFGSLPVQVAPIAESPLEV